MADREKYWKEISDGLDAAFERCAKQPERTLDIASARVVLVSDLHKGARDGADDFWRCERAYHAALGHYLQDGYTLIAMGDVEELWENWPKEVLKCYRATFELEAKFAADRYLRLWGNHDDLWRNEDEVAKHLQPLYGRELDVKEAIRFRVVDGDEPLGLLFLVHGHQGTAASDKNARWSRIFVRGWRVVQRITKRSLNTPATDFRLRKHHDEAMFRWARDLDRHEPLVMVAGHTHRPIFGDSWRAPVEVLEERLEERRQAGADAAELRRRCAEIELAKAEQRWRDPAPLPVSPPCYFNTGCCAFADGDITAIEIADRQIRLVRWLNDDDEPAPHELADPMDMATLMASVRPGGG